MIYILIFLAISNCAPEDWIDASGTSCYEYHTFASDFEIFSNDYLPFSCTDPINLANAKDGFSIANCKHCGCIPGVVTIPTTITYDENPNPTTIPTTTQNSIAPPRTTAAGILILVFKYLVYYRIRFKHVFLNGKLRCRLRHLWFLHASWSYCCKMGSS